MTIDKEFLQTIAPLANTRAMFDVFALGDGSGVYFCSSCGRRSEPPVEGMAQPITHKSDCAREAHYRAVAAVKQALIDSE